MSKEIDGGIVVINTITRATEDTDYPIVMASDVDLDSGISVEDKFKEIDERIAKLTAEKEAKTISEAARKELKALTHKRAALNTFVKNIPDWVIGVPRAMLTIALIPPILKYVFGLEKKKKSAPQQEQVAQAPKMDFIEKDVFKTVKGGAK